MVDVRTRCVLMASLSRASAPPRRVPAEVAEVDEHWKGKDQPGHPARLTVLQSRWHAFVTPAPVCDALAACLAERADTGSPALFLTKFGKGIGPRGIENLVTKHCKQATIVHASVRTLRHTMAVEMLKHGATPAVIGKALGHSSPDTVAVYTDLVRERMDGELQRHAL